MTNTRWIDSRTGNFLHLDLARRLVNDRAYAHAWLHGASACPDGCDGSSLDPERLEAYAAIPDAVIAIVSGLPVARFDDGAAEARAEAERDSADALAWSRARSA